MTCDAIVAKVLSDVCPVRKDAWRTGQSIPPLPWAVYSHRRGGEFYAGDDVYSEMQRYQVELFYEENDPDLISRFKRALRRLGAYKVYDDGYLESEGCLHVTFLITPQADKIREALDGQH